MRWRFDAKNFDILQSALRALKSGGKFIFTTLNGLFSSSNSIQESLSDSARDDSEGYNDHSFDLMP